MAQDIVPFSIAVPDAELELLKSKLFNVTFPSESEFADDWNYGTPLSHLKRLTEYWRDGFDWRAHEAKLNQIPQFTTKIAADGFNELNIHFIHQRSSRPGSIPLLFVHGWPGSFLEATKIVKLLAEPKEETAPSFHVVAPSLPNFGFSDRVTQKGFGLPQYAQTMHKLMLKLGYDKYVTQGGDWGFLVTRYISSLHPQHCLAAHTNCVIVKPPLLTSLWVAIRYFLGLLSAEEKQAFARTAWYMKDNSGYMVMQATKPNTLGFALADSPVAVLAWIYDKLHDWTDEYPWTDDEILEWVSIYQFSRAGAASSVLIYYEIIKMQMGTFSKMMEYIPDVPLGLSYFPKELSISPRAWGRSLGPVVFEGSHARGGHFAAYECPEELVGDLREMFGRGGGAAKVAERFKST